MKENSKVYMAVSYEVNKKGEECGSVEFTDRILVNPTEEQLNHLILNHQWDYKNHLTNIEKQKYVYEIQEYNIELSEKDALSCIYTKNGTYHFDNDKFYDEIQEMYDGGYNSIGRIDYQTYCSNLELENKYEIELEVDEPDICD